MSCSKSSVLFVNRRTGGGPSAGCGRGMKILLGLLGMLMVGGVMAGVAVPLFISLENAQGSTSTTTMGELRCLHCDCSR
jgi:hypothetical protein